MTKTVLLLLAGGVLNMNALGGEPDPWDPGVEPPSAEALASPLFIKPVPAAERSRVSFTVTEQAGVPRTNAPARGSLPFHRGELPDPARVRLLDPDGKPIPVQTLVTSFWPDGSARWLCLDFLTGLGAKAAKTFTLEYGSALAAPQAEPFASEKEGRISVTTGLMNVVFAKGRAFCEVAEGRTLEGKLVVHDAAGKPRELALAIEEARLTENGPVQATVYLRGAYGGEKTAALEIKDAPKPEGPPPPRFPFHAFVRVYRGTARMELIHSFGYNGDENADFVKRYGLVVGAKGGALHYGGEKGAPAEAPLHSALLLTQTRGSTWSLSGDANASGTRFGGWAGLGQTTVAVRNAWPQWPIAFEARPDTLSCWLYAAPEGEVLDLRYEGEHFGKSKSFVHGPSLSDEYGGGHGRAMGLLKIHELVLDFAGAPGETGPGVHLPLTVRPEPARMASTKALGHIGTYARAQELGFDTGKLQAWAEGLLDWPVIQHEANGIYGFIDWPDQADCNPPKNGRFGLILQGGVGWTNSERALLSYYFHYAAGGKEKYLHLGQAYALHTLGIDTEHPGGEMKAGNPHRHDQIHWRQGGEARQCGIRGWIAAYWMSGHPEIRRILFEEYLPNWRPQPGPGPETADLASKSTAYNYPNLLAYLTDRDPLWIKHHKGLDGGLLEALRQGHGIPYDIWKGGRMKWERGKLTLSGTAPGRIGGYWSTYGGDDRLAEHASLFGYAVSLEALRAWGDSYWKEGAPAPKFASYHSPDAGTAAYFLLTGNERARDWLEKELLARKSAGISIAWDTYTVEGRAEDWHKACGQGYGKNGFKIHGAIVYESLYALAAIEHARSMKSEP